MRRALFTLFLLIPPGLASAQPLSQSMAQCSGFYHGVGEMMSDPSRAERLEILGTKWRAAAIVEAGAEGRADPVDWVAGYQGASYDDWRERGKMAALSQDFRDWANYCRSLAKARKLDIASE